jgi:hypothetical protein
MHCPSHVPCDSPTVTVRPGPTRLQRDQLQRRGASPLGERPRAGLSRETGAVPTTHCWQPKFWVKTVVTVTNCELSRVPRLSTNRGSRPGRSKRSYSRACLARAALTLGRRRPAPARRGAQIRSGRHENIY